MPYFYKIDDFSDTWINAVSFACWDFMYGCDEDIILLFCKLDPTIVMPHKHKYEYYTENIVEPSHIQSKMIIPYNKNMSEMDITQIIRFNIPPFINDPSLYIHITCKSNYNSIMKHGLVDKGVKRIGNRSNTTKKSKPSPPKTKGSPKNKTKKRKLVIKIIS